MEKKILIVEDNPWNMRLMEMVLCAQGYTLLKATDGEEALAVARQGQPDLILMDIRLPRMNGLEATRRLRETADFRHTPIICVTALAMKGDRERIMAAGCDAYLPKPFDKRELLELIAAMLQRG